MYVKFQAAWGYPWIERNFAKAGVVNPGQFESESLSNLMLARNKAMFDDRGFSPLDGYVRVDLTHGASEVIVSGVCDVQ